MSFSEPKWRERVQFAEDGKASAKRAAGIRKIERSLKRCDSLESQRLASHERQHQLKVQYQAQVAYRSTQHMLNKFRETFAVQKNLDTKLRPSDKGYQIRMYTKVDRDAWENDQLREWYNDKKQQDVKFVSANQALDSAATAFVVDKPSDTDSSSLNNKKSHYMLKCGGPHDPSGFLKSVGTGAAAPGLSTVSMGSHIPHDSKITAGMPERPELPHLVPKAAPPKAALEAPHWGHWKKNLDYSAKVMQHKVASGQVGNAPPEPWATGY